MRPRVDRKAFASFRTYKQPSAALKLAFFNPSTSMLCEILAGLAGATYRQGLV
jgi:hypothetical protein